MYRSAILGCGGRARSHAQAYKDIKQGKIVAICDMNTELLTSFGSEFGIKDQYTDLDRMLQEQKPDLLHIVTAPTMRGSGKRIRYSLMKKASDHGVPAAIVEKPIAVDGKDWRELTELAREATTKFCVNTQLHFHPRNIELKKQVAAGRIGDIRFIDASARSTPIDQGPHILQLVSSYVDNSKPISVFGQVADGGPLKDLAPSTRHATATIEYANGVRANITFGTAVAPRTNDDESQYHHKRIAVLGTRGFAHWTMVGWELGTPDGGKEVGQHSYRDQDALGQSALTEAAFDWLGDEEKLHPTHLDQSLAEFNLLLGIFHSALIHEPITLPFDPPSGLIDALKTRLGSRH
jgi:predicted dehydrogenase